MNKYWRILTVMMFLVLTHGGAVLAQPPGQPPAVVETGIVTSGQMRVEKEFLGTIYFQETSLVAAEVSGRITAVHFEQGETVSQGAKLVTMDGVLKTKDLQSRRAQREEALVELARAQRELGRLERLFDQGTVSEQEYDHVRFQVEGLERRAEFLAAEIAKIQEELRKLEVRAPFDGIVLSRQSNLGEWLAPGSPVAEVARTGLLDIMVNVPVNVAMSLEPGQTVIGQAVGRELEGRVTAVIPRGDVGSRTFPVKVRLHDEPGLLEGMEVRLFMPTGESHAGLIVPRDAVVSGPMGSVIFLVREEQARMIPVVVVAFARDKAGIQAQGVEEGDLVVVRGQERLRDNQPVRLAGNQTEGAGP
ncbi:efflux RND transporter periplasmic adaptor subunit [Desulfonatronum parangueonense]